jgi:phage shock protein PspC (stress-responsive transcriptional regulator)
MNTMTADAQFDTDTDTDTATDTDTTQSQPRTRQLRRSADDAMLAGVAAGIARYLDADVTLIRLLIAALCLFTGAGPALYVAAWLLIPRDGEDQSLAAAWLARRRQSR